jgi:hypothetical protein
VLHAAAGHGIVIAPDFFGFGDSGPSAGGPLAADEETRAQDVLACSTSGLQRAVLAGHDVGADSQ